ncbi:hypothetical protein [Streptomyces sp. NBC_01314]|uniref:hypothetical protein n=1 Tax=Streptomyces sp. NBC_01314 TaxID=2903821 RepID=UPI0030924279|nr:hypothetical protein OG622_01185 [Streptomyces sp. NBC_01314]
MVLDIVSIPLVCDLCLARVVSVGQQYVDHEGDEGEAPGRVRLAGGARAGPASAALAIPSFVRKNRRYLYARPHSPSASFLRSKAGALLLVLLLGVVVGVGSCGAAVADEREGVDQQRSGVAVQVELVELPTVGLPVTGFGVPCLGL